MGENSDTNPNLLDIGCPSGLHALATMGENSDTNPNPLGIGCPSGLHVGFINGLAQFSTEN
jgi:hypothetical protein